MIPKTFECHFVCINKFIRYPDKEAGQIPLAYVVRKAGSSISENQVMDFVAGQVCLQHFSTIATFFFFQMLDSWYLEWDVLEFLSIYFPSWWLHFTYISCWKHFLNLVHIKYLLINIKNYILKFKFTCIYIFFYNFNNFSFLFFFNFINTRQYTRYVLLMLMCLKTVILKKSLPLNIRWLLCLFQSWKKSVFMVFFYFRVIFIKKKYFSK